MTGQSGVGEKVGGDDKIFVGVESFSWADQIVQAMVITSKVVKR